MRLVNLKCFPRAGNSSAKVCARGFLPSRLEAGGCVLSLPSLCFHGTSVLPFALTPLAVPSCVVFTTGTEFQSLKAQRHRELLLPSTPVEMWMVHWILHSSTWALLPHIADTSWTWTPSFSAGAPCTWCPSFWNCLNTCVATTS